MLIKKAMASAAGTATQADLALINQYALQPLTADEVFVFAVKLCDNAVDRDNECFPLETLKALQPMFVGRPGIFDHCWTAKGQTARIFRTEVVQEGGGAKNEATGEAYASLKAYAYIVKTDDTAGMIAQIAGGILKEVSVGCATRKCTCSICGKDIWSAECSHIRGKTYDGKPCVGILKDAADAYEWSFVAVPAQPKAGVTKSLTETDPGTPEGDAPSADKLAEMEHALAIEKLRFGG